MASSSDPLKITLNIKPKEKKMKTNNSSFYQYLSRAGIKPPAGLPNYQLPFKPWPHQAKRLRQVMREDKWGIYDDCATGKTFVMQSAALVHKASGYRSLVIMPPALLLQFEESLLDTFKNVEEYVYVYRLAAVKSKKGVTAAQQREAQISAWKKDGWPDVLLMSYEMFIKDFVQDHIVRQYQIYIVDEAHELRNLGNKAGNYLYDITNDPRLESALILATATPQYKDPRDAYCLIRLTAPGTYSSQRNFLKKHVVFKKQFIKMARPTYGKTHTTIYTVDRFMNLQELEKNLYKKADRITKDKVLPAAVPTIIEEAVELSDQHLRYYREFTRARIAELPSGEIIAATNAQALRQELLRIVTNVHQYSDKISAKKNAVLTACSTLIDGMGIGPKNKIVLFATSRTSIKMLAEHYAEFNPALMYGEVDSQKGRKKFLTDDISLMLIANPESAGAGLNLQSVCATFIFVEPVTIPGLFKQASERFPRAGQTRPVVGYVLKPKGTLASKMTSVMLEREGYILDASPDRGSFLLELEGR